MRRREVLVGGAAVAAGLMAQRQGQGAEAARSLAERLGHGKQDRLLMVHADDVGMCHSVNAATQRALQSGIVSCGSVMVPCPWFPEIAHWCQENPTADLGLHLTLTSEWSYYRWRPVSAPDQVKGLIDPDGFMWRRVEDVKAHAKPEEVEREIRAQIERARRFGMKPTHVDSHMGTLFADPAFFEVYTRVGKETGILPMIPGLTPDIQAEAKMLGLDYVAVLAKLEAAGFVILDRLVTGLTGDTLEERSKAFRELARGLKPGVTELIVHLAGDDEEIRHISGAWRNRFNDFQIVTDRETRAFLETEGIKMIGYRELGRLWKA